jgi:hypothetical protein
MFIFGLSSSLAWCLVSCCFMGFGLGNIGILRYGVLVYAMVTAVLKLWIIGLALRNWSRKESCGPLLSVFFRKLPLQLE